MGIAVAPSACHKKMKKPKENAGPECRRKRHSEHGFTLVETLVGLSMIALLGAGSFWTMTQMNVYATSARLYSEAIAKAEQQIDAILTKGPFDPAANPQLIPDELTLGTTTKTGVLIYR